MNLEFLYILTCFVTFACNLLDEVDGKFSQPLSLVKIPNKSVRFSAILHFPTCSCDW